MVAFAPTVPSPNVAATSDPEYTSYRWSRPIGAFEGNKSTAIATEGGAKALTEGVNATDALLQMHIEQGIQKDGTAKVDEFTKSMEGTLAGLRGEGNGALAYASAEATNSTEPGKKLDILTADKSDNTPADIKNLGPALDKIAARKANGSISETKFRGDIASMASQWRATWPGHVKEIDAEFDRVTQRGVANAYIQNMVKDIDSYNAAAKEKTNSVHALLQHAEEDGIRGSNVWRQKYDAGEWSESQVRAIYNQNMTWKHDLEVSKAKVEMADLKDKTAVKEAEDYLNHSGSNEVKSFFTTMEAAKQPGALLQDLRDGKINSEHALLYGQHLDTVNQQAKQVMREAAMKTKVKDGRTVFEALGPDRFNKLINENPEIQFADSVVKQLTGNKDHSAAVMSQEAGAALIADNDYSLMSSDSPLGRLRISVGVWEKSGMAGKQVADALLNNNLVGNAKTWMDQGIIVGGAQPKQELTGDDKDLVTFKSHYDEAVHNGRQSPAALKALTDKVSALMVDPKIPARIRAGYGQMAYDGRNLEFLENLELDHNDPTTGKKIKGANWFYQNLTTEEHAAAAKALGPEIWNKYQNYVEKAGEYLIGKETQKPIFTDIHDAVGAVKRGVTSFIGSRAEPESNFRFAYDNDNNEFHVQLAGKPRSEDRPYWARQQKLMEDSVKNVNEIIKSVSTMSKISGQDPNVYLYKTLAPLAQVEPSIKKMFDALVASHQETETP